MSVKTRLKTLIARLANALTAKGVEASAEETLTALVGKVSSIEQGGIYEDIYYAATAGGRTYDCLFKVEGFDASGITTVPWFDTSKGVNFRQMFHSQNYITTVPNYDTSSGTDFSNMFYNCTRLITIPSFDLSCATNIGGMFYGCTSLVDASGIDITNAESAFNAFYGCASLKVTPKLDDLSNTTSVASMFGGCSSLEELNTDTGIIKINAGAAQDMFNGCKSLKMIDKIDWSDGKGGIQQMFFNCKSLESVGLFVFGTIKSAVNFAKGCTALTRFIAGGTIGMSITFADSPLDAESAKSIINALVDYAGSSNEFVYTVSFSDQTKNALEVEGSTAPGDITWMQYAQVKGWNI